MWQQTQAIRFKILLHIIYWITIISGINRFKFHGKKKRFFASKILTIYSICLTFLAAIVGPPLIRLYIEFSLKDEVVNDVLGLSIMLGAWIAQFSIQYFCFLISIYCIWWSKFDLLELLNEGVKLVNETSKKYRMKLQLESVFWISLTYMLLDVIIFSIFSLWELPDCLQDDHLPCLTFIITQFGFMFSSFIQFIKCFAFLYASQLFRGFQRRLSSIKIEKKSKEIADIFETYQRIITFVIRVENFLILQTSFSLLSNCVTIIESVSFLYFFKYWTKYSKITF
jgi:hypothetical protein